MLVSNVPVAVDARARRVRSTLEMLLALAALGCANPERPPRGATGSNAPVAVTRPIAAAPAPAASSGRPPPSEPAPQRGPRFYTHEHVPIWQLAVAGDYHVYVHGYDRRLRPGWSKGTELHGVRVFAVDPRKHERLVAVDFKGVSISEDFGTTWQPITGLDGAEITALAIAADGSIYAGTRRNGLHVHDGNGWIALGRLPPQISALAAGPSPGAPVYVAAPPNLLLRSDDRGATWSGVQVLDADGQPLQVDTLLAGGERGMTLHAIAGRRLLRSEDGGKTFVQLELPAKLAVSSAAVMTGDEAMIAAGTDAGVFVSRDSGRSWALHYEGLPATRIDVVVLRRRRVDTLARQGWAGQVVVGNAKGLFGLDFDEAWMDGTAQSEPQADHIRRDAIRTVPEEWRDELPSVDPAALSPDALVATPAQQRAQEVAAAEARARFEALDRTLQAASYKQMDRDFARGLAREQEQVQAFQGAVARSKALCARINAGYKPTAREIETLIRDVETFGIEAELGADQWARIKRSMRAGR